MPGLALKESTVYFRGQFVPFTDANLSIASSPVLYGLSIYTVFPVCWNERESSLYIYRLKEHYMRLCNSAKIVDFHSFVQEWPFEKFQSTMLEVIKRNKVQEDALVRATVFIDEIAAGTKIHDLTNSLSVFVYPAVPIMSATGVNVCVSSWQRTADNAIPSRAKVNGSYINASLMKNEALLNGYDEAIALDEHGHVSESTVANVFIVRDGILITPDNATDLLEGIGRQSLLEISTTLSIPTQQRSIDRSELYIADEVLLCGSSMGITPVLSVDKRPVGDGQPGKFTQQLNEHYEAILHGQDPAYADWVQKVE